MVDGSVEQFHEALHIISQFCLHNMNMDECIIVSSIVNKFPPSWKDYKKSLKHTKKRKKKGMLLLKNSVNIFT